MTKIGIFGGFFNPIHNGHINVIETVKNQMELEKVIVVPTNISPGRIPTQGPSSKDRLEMVKRVLANHEDIEVSDFEVEKGGTSYSIDTLNHFCNDKDNEEFYLIIGQDQFEKFHLWREFPEILKLVNLVVVSRPGNKTWEDLFEDLPDEISSQIRVKKETFAETISGKSIFSVKLEDIDVSATEIRSRLIMGENLENIIPAAAEEFIKENSLYNKKNYSPDNIEGFVRACAKIMEDKKAIDPVAKDMRNIDMPSSFALICSGTSRKHAQSIASGLVKDIKSLYNIYPHALEGQEEGRWLVIDYGFAIIHVFYDFTRNEYTLEDLWKNVEDFSL